MTVPLLFSVDLDQNYHAGGRLDWAADAATGGAMAKSRREYASAVSFSTVSDRRTLKGNSDRMECRKTRKLAFWFSLSDSPSRGRK